MNRRRLLHIGKTEIQIHVSVMVYALYAILTGRCFAVCISLISIVLHEAAHAVVSALSGHAPRSIELTLLGAVMKLEDDDLLPTVRRLLVILAGPAMTCAICLLSSRLTLANICNEKVGKVIFMSNLSILMINMLPVFPLDGGRLLSMILNMLISKRLVNRVMRIAGLLTGLGLICVNIYVSWKYACFSLSLAMIGCCIMYCSSTATNSYALYELQSFMDRKIRFEKHCTCKTRFYTVAHTQPLCKVIRLLPENRIAAYVCVEAGSARFLGEMTEFDLIQAYLKTPDGTMKDALKYSKNENLSKNSTK